MRTHLVTKLVCVKCGGLLNLSYDKVLNPYSEGEPSGAFMYENAIGVEPCEKCYEPARRVLDAVAVLMESKQ
jgi:hypothetical protein